MKKDAIVTETAEIVKDIERSGKVIQSREVLELIPELISTVRFNRDYVIKCIKNEIGSGSKNPINALLGLMGLRIVHTQNTINVLCEEFTTEDCSAGTSGSILRLDSAKLYKTADNMADLLASIEQSSKDDYQKGVSRQNELHSELNNKNNEYNQLFAEYKNQQKAVVERVQYMLGICGENENNQPLKEQLGELLEDLDMEVYWNSENTAMSEQSMFTILKCSEPEKRKTKPCIVRNGEVIMKGTKFISE